MEQYEQNPFNKSELTTILVVLDMSESKKFCLDCLGAQLFREYGGNSMVLKERGVDFITQPCTWGAEIRCLFTDPDGHLFEKCEYKEAD